MLSFVELVIVAIVIVISITEFFYPLIAGKPFFGSFRKPKNNKREPEDKSTHKIN